jgi:hypothetical protein
LGDEVFAAVEEAAAANDANWWLVSERGGGLGISVFGTIVRLSKQQFSG